MMKRFFGFLTVALVTCALIFTGCPTDNNSGSENSYDPLPGERFFSGIFNGMKFVVNQVGSAFRSMDGDSSQLWGLVEDENGNTYDISGFYDEDSGNFHLSGGSANKGFQIDGVIIDGEPAGSGYDRTKEGGNWEENTSEITFSDDVSISDSANTAPATSLPAKWHGKWDYSNQDNAHAVEQWYTTWGGEAEFCMVLSSQSIRMWIDVAALEELYKDHDADWRKDQIDQILKMQNEINVLEVTRINDNEYHLLVSLVRPENYDGDGSVEYRKIRLLQEGDALKATLAVINEIDPGEDLLNALCSSNINTARLANTYLDRPFSQMGYMVVTLYMAKYGASPATSITVAQVMPDIDEGVVAENAKVTLSTATAGAEIWYTTSGRTPTKGSIGSTKYAEPITITSDVTIKAAAFKTGMIDSPIFTAAYTIGTPVILPFITVGYYYSGGNTSRVACYWQGGVRKTLPGGSEAIAVTVTDDGDIYIAGVNDSYLPCYWKLAANGTATKTDLTMPDETGYNAAIATAIAVKTDGTVYVAGTVYSVPYCWKDGVPYKLSLPGGGYFALGHGGVNAITIDDYNNRVYLAGYGSNGGISVAGYWREEGFGNGFDGMATLTDPAGNYNAEATSITVRSNGPTMGTVYIAGYDGTPCYWTKQIGSYTGWGQDPNAKTDLSATDNGQAYAITVKSDGTVYAAGYYVEVTGTVEINGEEVDVANILPCYWTDDGTTKVKTPLSSTSPWGEATAIAIIDDDIYVAGYTGESFSETGCYWKYDGTTTEKRYLSGPGVVNAMAVLPE